MPYPCSSTWIPPFLISIPCLSSTHSLHFNTQAQFNRQPIAFPLRTTSSSTASSRSKPSLPFSSSFTCSSSTSILFFRRSLNKLNKQGATQPFQFVPHFQGGLCASSLERAPTASGAEMENGHLFALDFDGVLCDSCGESSISALKAAKVRWPDIFSGVDVDTESWILESMRTVRPVVETGYENVLLVRLLLESKYPKVRQSSVADGLTVDRILEDWTQLKPSIMKDWNESNRNELVDLFATVRDDWIAHDLKSWIGANRFYPGIADSLRFAASKVYIVTTKQARFAQVLLKELACVDISSDHVYGLGTGPKVEVLKQLQGQPEHQGLKLHFVEDRLATLQNVMKEPALDNWNIYLGTWGYNTAREREAAASVSRIRLLDLPDFCGKLK